MSAPATPALIARAAGRFIAIGGRLMIDPMGEYSARIDFAKLFERTWPSPDDPAPFVRRRAVAQQFDFIERGRERQMAELVRQRGKPTATGWLVWEAC